MSDVERIKLMERIKLRVDDLSSKLIDIMESYFTSNEFKKVGELVERPNKDRNYIKGWQYEDSCIFRLMDSSSLEIEAGDDNFIKDFIKMLDMVVSKIKEIKKQTNELPKIFFIADSLWDLPISYPLFRNKVGFNIAHAYHANAGSGIVIYMGYAILNDKELGKSEDA